jgi:hypothetical protein
MPLLEVRGAVPVVPLLASRFKRRIAVVDHPDGQC